MSAWKLATALAALVFFSLSCRWSYTDNSPPSWDPGLYLYQATILHNSLMQNGIFDFFTTIFNFDRGRVPLLPVIAQPAFYFLGPSLDAAVFSLNFAWFVLAWALHGIAKELAGPHLGDKAGFFAFVLFGLYPITTLLSHNFLVEFLLMTFICAAIYSLWLLHKTGRKKWSVFSGIFICLGLLTKVTFPAFVLPAFLILFYRNTRNSTVWKTLLLFLPAILLVIIFAGSYYFYNYRPLIAMTTVLSSSNLAQLYGFDGAFDVDAVLQYLRAVFVNPPALIAILCVVAMLILRFIYPREKNENVTVTNQAQSLSSIILVWFVIPFFIATFGTIKDPRYIYPALVPLFIFAGVMVSRFSQSKLLTILVALVSIVPLSGYLYTNNWLSEDLVSHKMGSALAFYPDSRPDPRAWKVDELVSGIANKLEDLQANKTVLFLGGNRYYHIRLLDFEGLLGGIHLNYMALPYYSNPLMSLEEALEFIENNSPGGIIYKSGENWPPFSSRLDSEIVAQLYNNLKYKAVDLKIIQPDESRFTLFVNTTKTYVLIESVSNLVGNWKAGSGVASIAYDAEEVLKLTTETRDQGLAQIQNGIIYVPQWNVSGRLTQDLKHIHWSNGFVWERNTYVTIKSTSDLVGNWKVGNGMASVTFNDTGTLKLITETGSQGFAYIQDGMIFVPSWNVSGLLTGDFKYIQWNNGLIWERNTSEKQELTEK